MHKSAIIAAALCSTAALAAPAPQLQARESNETANNLDLITKLELAPTAVDRAALLKPEDWVYDFANPPADATTSGAGGHTVKADRKTFPALVGTGVSMTVGFLGPCGFNTPHTHPRSSEINIIVQGKLQTQFVAENGVKPVSNPLSQYQMTVFPRGALHLEANYECEDAVFVAGFASEDPGVEQAAQSLFSLEPELIKADLGIPDAIPGAALEKFRDMIPHNVALGVEQCLKKCGIKKEDSLKKAEEVAWEKLKPIFSEN